VNGQKTIQNKALILPLLSEKEIPLREAPEKYMEDDSVANLFFFEDDTVAYFRNTLHWTHLITYNTKGQVINKINHDPSKLPALNFSWHHFGYFPYWLNGFYQKFEKFPCVPNYSH
jgi:hypothetical protein